jgi:phosphonate metabolism protein (transferase hexapeptide repeat family)
MKLIDRFPPNETPSPKRLSAEPQLHPSARVRHSVIGAWTDIGPGCSIAHATLGDYTYTAGDVMIIYAEIGKFCSIAAQVRVNPGNHPMERVTQHHLTYRRVQYGLDSADDADFFAWRAAARCIIGHDVWIGHAATIMPGVRIGTGAVVGAGAVVTKDVAPYEIVAGVPARHIRLRFAPPVVEQLLRIAWWDWDRATLEARFHDLLDLPTFLARYDSALPD